MSETSSPGGSPASGTGSTGKRIRSLARRLLYPGRLPDFLCIGAQKAGTTTLHELLGRHPGVHLAERKEIHYFSLHFARPLGWYRERFTGARRRQRIGETTPYYLFHPLAPGWIAETLPDVRLIVLVRDPVERAISGYFHARRNGMEPLAIDEAFAAEDGRLSGAEAVLARPGDRHESHQWHGYASRSRYEVQLDRYLARFPRSRLLLVRSEDLFADPRGTWATVLGHLGLEPIPLPEANLRRNAGDGEATGVSAELRARLRERLAPTYEAMRIRFGIEWPDRDAKGGRDG